MPPLSHFSKKKFPVKWRGKPFFIAFVFCVLVMLLSVFVLPASSLIGKPLQALSLPFWQGRLAVFREGNGFLALLSPKAALQARNDVLEEKVQELEAQLASYIQSQKVNFRAQPRFSTSTDAASESAVREIRTRSISARVLVKPPQTPYGTLVIAAGSKSGVSEGDLVLAPGQVALGTVAGVFSRTSTVELFSAPERKTTALLGESEIPLTAIGRGGGNFVIRAPRDLDLEEGAYITLAGEPSVFLGEVNAILSEPADPFKIIVFRTPVNLHELIRVQVTDSPAIYIPPEKASTSASFISEEVE